MYHIEYVCIAFGGYGRGNDIMLFYMKWVLLGFIDMDLCYLGQKMNLRLTTSLDICLFSSAL